MGILVPLQTKCAYLHGIVPNHTHNKANLPFYSPQKMLWTGRHRRWIPLHLDWMLYCLRWLSMSLNMCTRYSYSWENNPWLHHTQCPKLQTQTNPVQGKEKKKMKLQNTTTTTVAATAAAAATATVTTTTTTATTAAAYRFISKF